MTETDRTDSDTRRTYTDSVIRAAPGLLVVVTLFLLIHIALPAPATGLTISTSEESRIDSIPGDTLVYVDSSQPRVRGGFFIGPAGATAHLEQVALEPGYSPGFFGGIRSELEFADPLYFLLEVELFDRRLYSTPTNGGSLTGWDFHFLYLQFPLLFQVQLPLGGGPDLTVAAGAVPGIVLSSKQVYHSATDETTSPLDSGVQNFDFCFEFRAGSQWDIGVRSALSIDLRYLLGLQNILILATREDPRVWKARSFGLSVGWLYQLQRPIYRE